MSDGLTRVRFPATDDVLIGAPDRSWVIRLLGPLGQTPREAGPSSVRQFRALDRFEQAFGMGLGAQSCIAGCFSKSAIYVVSLLLWARTFS